MSSEDKPKSGEVRLSITQSELRLLENSLSHAMLNAPHLASERIRDLLAIIKSQTKAPNPKSGGKV